MVNSIAVSRDHKPDQSDERERIENAGGFVMWTGTWRVGGILAVSRAFDDRLLKQYVVADPEIRKEKIDDSLEFLILASDGLWDVFSKELQWKRKLKIQRSQRRNLWEKQIKSGSADNITCFVVRFLETASSSLSSNEANLMPPIGDLKISSSESKQVQVDSESIVAHNKPENVNCLADESGTGRELE